MILETQDLPRLSRKVAMADGGFDPIHAGHVLYLRAVAALGFPVLVNLTPDSWVERKHPVFLPQEDRSRIVDALRWVDYTHVSSIPTVQVLELLRPRIYVKGSDWRGRIPETETRTCAQHGIELVFLDTVTNSSTAILDRYRDHVRQQSDGRA